MLILEEPEFGIVYQNAKSEKCFLRFDEVQKYSDGTLKLIRQKSNRKLDADNKEKEMDKRDRSLIERAVDAIQDRLNFQNAIRRFESYFGLRKKTEVWA